MRGEDFGYDGSINYSQPHNIRIPSDLDLQNSAVEEHMILKGHVAAKYEAKREFRERQKEYYESS